VNLGGDIFAEQQCSPPTQGRELFRRFGELHYIMESIYRTKIAAHWELA
jgi:hypothetical protein